MDYLIFLGFVALFAATCLTFVIYVFYLGWRVEKLMRKVAQLEEQSHGFYPDSHHYLNDLNEWLTRKGG
jgi:hypothetical protein